jgi:transcriptional regulator with XRE-family HTH domain
MANALRALREAKGLSQEKLAIEADIHRTMVGAYERAERNISLLAVQNLLTGMGATWSDLCRELDKHAPIRRPRRDDRRRR